ncbi:MAG: type I 3-dehydroquinate dehydratase [Candidatus Bathyarchaeia archaeon]
MNFQDKICPVITSGDDEVINLANKFKIVELRIDFIGKSWIDVANRIKTTWIATCRSVREGGLFNGEDKEIVDILLQAIEVGASYVDIEISLTNLSMAIKLLKSRGAKIIVSYHNFVETPSPEELVRIVKREITYGAEVWKVATLARSYSDCIAILRLLTMFKEIPGIAIAMGDLGIITRILSPLLGGFLTYASVKRELESAVGQLTVNELLDTYSLLNETG